MGELGSFPPKTPRRGVDSATRKLARSLLARAGLSALVDIRPLAMHSNANYLIEATDGGRYVLRRFSEKAPPHTALARLDRECWAYRRLALAGVPVPRLFARSRQRRSAAMLTAFVDGQHLGTIVPSLPPQEAASAWSACGRALAAVHAIDGRSAAEAGCERAGINDPTASRGLWHYEEALTFIERLARVRPDLGSLSELTAAVTEARVLYERAPLALCHFDAHLWQFLVARDERHQWDCTAILDWEHADLDDPDWDLAQLDGFRWGTLDVVPPEFFAGYGRMPKSPLYTLYRLERAAWILWRYASADSEWLALSAPLAERFITAALARPAGLREATVRCQNRRQL